MQNTLRTSAGFSLALKHWCFCANKNGALFSADSLQATLPCLLPQDPSLSATSHPWLPRVSSLPPLLHYSENNHILPGSDTSTGAFTSIFPHCLCHFTDGKTEAQGSQNDKPRGSTNRVGMTSLRFSLQHPRSLSCTRRVGIRDRRLVSTLPDTEQEKTRARVRGCQGWSFSSRRGKKKQKGNVRPRGSDPNPAPGSED